VPDYHQERKTANYSMWYGVLLQWRVGGQEGGSVTLCAWCEGVELILKINKYSYLLHPVGLDFITLPTVKMHGQTQIKLRYGLFNYHASLFTT
jgi:hypothetical protein